jgi:hypothetical protein
VTLPIQQQQCLAILDKLSSYSISTLFAQPVDPVRDIFQIIPPLSLIQWISALLGKSFFPVNIPMLLPGVKIWN